MEDDLYFKVIKRGRKIIIFPELKEIYERQTNFKHDKRQMIKVKQEVKNDGHSKL